MTYFITNFNPLIFDKSAQLYQFRAGTRIDTVLKQLATQNSTFLSDNEQMLFCQGGLRTSQHATRDTTNCFPSKIDFEFSQILQSISCFSTVFAKYKSVLFTLVFSDRTEFMIL